jgi:hypothetical protein
MQTKQRHANTHTHTHRHCHTHTPTLYTHTHTKNTQHTHNTHTHTLSHTHSVTHTHTHTHMYTHTRTHTHTHTHTHSPQDTCGRLVQIFSQLRHLQPRGSGQVEPIPTIELWAELLLEVSPLKPKVQSEKWLCENILCKKNKTALTIV